MGKDHPDWGGVYNDTQFYPLFDMAELAARLGSPITYDRRGALIWCYDFSHGIGHVTLNTTLGATYALDATYWERPPFSLKLITGANALSQVYVARRLSTPQPDLVGAQVSILFGDNVDGCYLYLDHYTGALRRYAQVQVDLPNRDFKVYDKDTGSVTLNTDIPDLASAAYFARLKVVADLNTHKYVRALLDDNEYDCSAYEMGSQADTTAPRVELMVLLTNNGATEAVIYVDSLILTAAEPPN